MDIPSANHTTPTKLVEQVPTVKKKQPDPKIIGIVKEVLHTPPDDDFQLGIRLMKRDNEYFHRMGISFIRTGLGKTNGEAEMHLAEAYYNGRGVVCDKKAALYCYEEAALQGTVCEKMLGLLYCEPGLEDSKKAMFYLKIAVKKDPLYKLKINLGKLLCFDGPDQDVSYAIKLYEKALKQKEFLQEEYAFSVCLLGRMEIGVFDNRVHDKEAGIAHLEAAAKLDEPIATHALGVVYFSGELVDTNNELAVQYIKKASLLGNVDAILILSQCYFLGLVVSYDPILGFEKLEEIEHENIGSVFFRMGQCYKDGEGVVQNKKSSFEYHLKAVEAGYRPAYEELALDHFFARGTAKNVSLARKYFLDSNSSLSHFYLGLIYLKGIGIDQDSDLGMEYLQASADAENITAMMYLARYIEQDQTKVVGYYESVTRLDRKNTLAPKMAGGMYGTGVRIHLDRVKAVKYLEIAMERGDLKAYHILQSLEYRWQMDEVQTPSKYR